MGYEIGVVPRSLGTDVVPSLTIDPVPVPPPPSPSGAAEPPPPPHDTSKTIEENKTTTLLLNDFTKNLLGLEVSLVVKAVNEFDAKKQ